MSQKLPVDGLECIKDASSIDKKLNKFIKIMEKVMMDTYLK